MTQTVQHWCDNWPTASGSDPRSAHGAEGAKFLTRIKAVTTPPMAA